MSVAFSLIGFLFQMIYLSTDRPEILLSGSIYMVGGGIYLAIVSKAKNK